MSDANYQLNKLTNQRIQLQTGQNRRFSQPDLHRIPSDIPRLDLEDNQRQNIQPPPPQQPPPNPIGCYANKVLQISESQQNNLEKQWQTFMLFHCTITEKIIFQICRLQFRDYDHVKAFMDMLCGENNCIKNEKIKKETILLLENIENNRLRLQSIDVPEPLLIPIFIEREPIIVPLDPEPKPEPKWYRKIIDQNANLFTCLGYLAVLLSLYLLSFVECVKWRQGSAQHCDLIEIRIVCIASWIFFVILVGLHVLHEGRVRGLNGCLCVLVFILLAAIAINFGLLFGVNFS